MDAAWITDIGRCVGAAWAYWVVGEASVVVAKRLGSEFAPAGDGEDEDGTGVRAVVAGERIGDGAHDCG
jgi:hypothetical protein